MNSDAELERIIEEANAFFYEMSKKSGTLPKENLKDRDAFLAKEYAAFVLREVMENEGDIICSNELEVNGRICGRDLVQVKEIQRIAKQHGLDITSRE